ncbi:MAG: DUF1570 domain-containing protein [Planctomycetaceae bacterium]|nr:DUF1570 domain-containing protein [Planctomycetaceae bacterium]
MRFDALLSPPVSELRFPADVRPAARAFSYRTLLVCALLGGLGLSGCRLANRADTVGLPTRHSVKNDQLRVLSDIKLPKDHALLKDLEALRGMISETLVLPVQEQPVTVYLFGDETRYSQYLQATYPNLPPRRAYFVGTSQELAVYTFWGERIQEDLRHEYTHGVLHASLKDVPLWLDEGLAEYFEVAEPPVGFNRDYVQRMRSALHEGWRPDLDRLETLEAVGDMKKPDYFESWAWVHFMLEDSPDSRGVLVDYLRELRTTARPGRLSQRLRKELPDADARFLAHCATLSEGIIAAGALSNRE